MAQPVDSPDFAALPVPLRGDYVAVRVYDLMGSIPRIEADFGNPSQGVDGVGPIVGVVPLEAGGDFAAVQEPVFGDQAILLVVFARGNSYPGLPPPLDPRTGRVARRWQGD